MNINVFVCVCFVYVYTRACVCINVCMCVLCVGVDMLVRLCVNYHQDVHEYQCDLSCLLHKNVFHYVNRMIIILYLICKQFLLYRIVYYAMQLLYVNMNLL